jgi:hypothetical protein
MTHRLALLVCLAACGARATPSPSAADLPSWLVGSWLTSDGRGAEHWHPGGGALLGVAFPAGGTFEVMIIAPTADGRLRFTAWPGGDGGVAFEATAMGATHVVFANPAHDFPREVGYRRLGDHLSAFIGPGGGRRSAELAWRRSATRPAPHLEQADLAFAADTAASGSAGWAAWFDAEGAQWRPGLGRIVGPDAIRELMRPVLDREGQALRWTPRASGLGPGGDLGFTIGDYVSRSASGESGRGGYVTVWRRQPDGGWKVLFDQGT